MERKTCPHPTCGYEWTPRKANPVKCPQCTNPLWRSPNPKKKRVKTEVSPESIEAPAPPGVEFPRVGDGLIAAKNKVEELFRRLQ